MRALASISPTTLRSVTWAIFWRFAILSTALTFAVSFVIGFAVNAIWGFQVRSTGVSQETMMAMDIPEGIVFWQGILIAVVTWILSFFALRWVIRSLYGRNIGGSTFLLVAMSNDKDFSNAN